MLLGAGAVGLVFFLLSRERGPDERGGPVYVMGEESSDEVGGELPEIRPAGGTAREPTGEVDLGRNGDGPDPEEAALSIAENMGGLRALVLELPEFDGTDAGIRKKYEGLSREDLKSVYPILMVVQRQEMAEALDLAIETGLASVEITSGDTMVDTSKYQTPGEIVNTVAHRATPLADGTVEHVLANLDKDHFPDMYVRSYELSWVANQVYGQ
ncbi:MAG TPA: hypothetical protein ENJ09_12365 [Planctomycetes bacterium]|nr:hypothetical protein [Planctomycetota bacterium]